MRKVTAETRTHGQTSDAYRGYLQPHPIPFPRFPQISSAKTHPPIDKSTVSCIIHTANRADVFCSAGSPRAAFLGREGLGTGVGRFRRILTPHKVFRMNTYKRTPRFSRNQPKLSARNPFGCNTYRLHACNPFIRNTYKKQGEGYPGCRLRPSALPCTLLQKSEPHPLSIQPFADSLQKPRHGIGFPGFRACTCKP